MSAEYPQISGIVRNARKSLGLSQSELAKKSGISRHTIGEVETNKRMPSLDAFCQLIRALDISADRYVYPHHERCKPEHEQFFNEFLNCDEYEQEILIGMMRSLHHLRALRHNEPEKQG